MAYKFQINNVLYTPRDGFVVKEEFNETLDSGLVMLTKSGLPLNIEPYDIIKLSGDSISTKTFLVDNFNEDKIAFTPTEKYEYTINLFSETKVLERITLPNLSITQNITGQANRSIWFYFQHYVSFYGPKIKVRNPELATNPSAFPKWLSVSKYAINNELLTRLQSIDCPEFQWNNPTLREVLNDLLGVINLIVAVRNNVITYFDITQRGSAIDQSKLNNQQRMRGSGDYVSDLNIEIQNAIGKNIVKNIEYISFRQSSEGVLDDKNLQIIVQRPIYKIVKAYLIGLVLRQGNNVDNHQPSVDRRIVRKVDITDFIKEKADWDTLESTTINLADGFIRRNTHKQPNAYFTRGGNVIDGWGLRYSGFISEQSTWNTILWGSGFVNQIAPIHPTFNIRDLMVMIEYESLDNTKALTGKYLPIKNENLQTFDNQQNSFTDLQAQGVLQYLKINRLSNSIITIYGEYTSENDIPKLGDTLNEKVLFSREVAYFDGYFKFKGMLTENYIITQWFTALQSVKRSWQYAQASEALQRYDIEKYYAEFSFRQKTDNNVFNFTTDTPALFLSPFQTTWEDTAVKQSLVWFVDDLNTALRIPRTITASGTIPVGVGYLVDTDTEVFGNSILMTFAFDDNITAGRYTRIDGTVYRNDIYPYVSETGRNRGMQVRYLDFYNPGENVFNMPAPWIEFKDANSNNDTQTLRDNLKTLAYRRPLVKSLSGTLTYFQNFKGAFKDNREITKFTTQFEFCSDTPDIVFGDAFLKRQRIVNEDDQYNIAGSITGGHRVFSTTIFPQSDLTPYDAGNPATWFTGPTPDQYFYSQQYVSIGTNENNYTGPYVYRIFNIQVFSGVFQLYLYRPTQNAQGKYIWDATTRILLSDNGVIYNWEKNKWVGYVRLSGAFHKTHPTNLNRLYVSTTKKFSLYDKTLSTTGYTEISGNVFTYTQLTQQTAKIEVIASFSNNVISWAIVDFRGNLLIGVNGGLSKRVVYLNFMTSRDNKVYWAQDNQTIVGDMQDSTFTLALPFIDVNNNDNLVAQSSGGGSSGGGGSTGGGGGGGGGGGNQFTQL